MRRTTKALVATAALAVGIAAAVIVPKAYKWSRHKEDVVVVRKQEKKEPPLQAVPVRADAGMEKSPQAHSELEEGSVKKRYGRVTGELQGYEEMIKRVRKRLEALEQTP